MSSFKIGEYPEKTILLSVLKRTFYLTNKTKANCYV